MDFFSSCRRTPAIAHCETVELAVAPRGDQIKYGAGSARTRCQFAASAPDRAWIRLTTTVIWCVVSFRRSSWNPTQSLDC